MIKYFSNLLLLFLFLVLSTQIQAESKECYSSYSECIEEYINKHFSADSVSKICEKCKFPTAAETDNRNDKKDTSDFDTNETPGTKNNN